MTDAHIATLAHMGIPITKEDMVMGDKTRGLYGKFTVTRNDGSSREGGKHENCDYFVLDLSHDSHAISALKAYADSCRDDYPLLADDLDQIVQTSGVTDGLTPSEDS